MIIPFVTFPSSRQLILARLAASVHGEQYSTGAVTNHHVHLQPLSAGGMRRAGKLSSRYSSRQTCRGAGPWAVACHPSTTGKTGAENSQTTSYILQVYGFSVATTPTYKGYDWSLLTTSAWRTDPELVDLAKQHDARVELNAGNVANIMGDAAKRKQWVCVPVGDQTCVDTRL